MDYIKQINNNDINNNYNNNNKLIKRLKVKNEDNWWKLFFNVAKFSWSFWAYSSVLGFIRDEDNFSEGYKELLCLYILCGLSCVHTGSIVGRHWIILWLIFFFKSWPFWSVCSITYITWSKLINTQIIRSIYLFLFYFFDTILLAIFSLFSPIPIYLFFSPLDSPN